MSLPEKTPLLILRSANQDGGNDGAIITCTDIESSTTSNGAEGLMMMTGESERSSSSHYDHRQNYGSMMQMNDVAGASERTDSSSSRRRSWLRPYSLSESMRQLSQRLREIVAEHVGTIGMLGSLSIAVNSITGPAMLDLPATFARSGIIPTIVTLIVVCILSSLCSLHMASVISKVPGNANFKMEVEYSEAFRAFGWGDSWFIATQVLFLCCITCLNISSIVDTAQVVDVFLGHWWPNGSAAVQFGGEQHTTAGDIASSFSSVDWLRWDYSICTKKELLHGYCLPFKDSEGTLVTAGTALTTLFFLPLALLDLKENAWWQVVAFAILLITSAQFIIQFSMSDLDPSALSWWGHTWNDLLGVVLFNFALVITVPAWLYERQSYVDVPTVVNGSTVLSVILYISIGVLGCMALPNVSDNMLESMMSGAFGTAMQLGSSIFAFAIIGLGIPLFSVLTRMNLTGSGLCSRQVGNIFAVYFPFGVSWLLYGEGAVKKLLSWGGIVFTSLVAFLLPLALAIYVVREFDYEGSVSVYFGMLANKRSELLALWILIAVAVFAIAMALIGNVLAT